jgi:hypothetical protein
MKKSNESPYEKVSKKGFSWVNMVEDQGNTFA